MNIMELGQLPSCLIALSPKMGGTWWSALRSKDGIDTGVYGIIYNPNVATATQACTRVVYNDATNTLHLVTAHASLPAHNFKRCVMDNLATRHINYYLDSVDSTKRADGSAADLTGADGDVMVEIPITHWHAETMTDGRILYLVANREFVGSIPHPFFYVSPDGATLRTQYVGAYQSTICDATGARLADMMNQSLVAPAAYAAGYKARSVAGCKPWTNMTQAVSRTAANANGATDANGLFHQYLMLMMCIEYNSFDTQAVVSPGFTNASAWDYAFTRLSGRANFGNGTGNALIDSAQDSAITWNAVADTAKVIQFSYRGIENPYGEIWKFEDGIQKYQADGAANGKYWWTAATSNYTNVDQNEAASPVYTSVAHTWPISGWTKSWNPNTFFQTVLGGSNSTYMCDYFYNDTAAGSRIVVRGGNLSGSTFAGMGCIYVAYGLTFGTAHIGSRLAC